MTIIQADIDFYTGQLEAEFRRLRQAHPQDEPEISRAICACHDVVQALQRYAELLPGWKGTAP